MKNPQGKVVQLHGDLSEEEERQDRIDSTFMEMEAILQSLFTTTHGDIPRARFFLLSQMDLRISALKQLLAGEDDDEHAIHAIKGGKHDHH
jgi:hypothetical protein